MGSGAKSYMRKGFLIYDDMRQFFPIYEEAQSCMTLHPIPLHFLIYEENFFFFFISLPNVQNYVHWLYLESRMSWRPGRSRCFR